MALEDTLKAIAERSRADADVETGRPATIMRWRQSVEDLYGRMQEWLAPHLKAGVLDIEFGESEVREESFGQYSVPILTIRAGTYVVVVLPIARAIIGGLGRVDMYRQGRSARDERALLIRNDDEVQANWSIRQPSQEGAGDRRAEPLTEARFEAALDGLLR